MTPHEQAARAAADEFVIQLLAALAESFADLGVTNDGLEEVCGRGIRQHLADIIIRHFPAPEPGEGGLLPCPWCQAPMRVQKTDYEDEPIGRRWSSNCTNGDCHSFGPMEASRKKAISASNRRAAPAPAGGEGALRVEPHAFQHEDHHPSCNESDVELKWSCGQCGFSEHATELTEPGP